MSKFASILKVLVFITVFIGISVIYLRLVYVEHFSNDWVSLSIVESKRIGALVNEVKATPKTFKYFGTRFTLSEVFLEKGWRIDYKYYLFPRIVYTNTHYLCFILKNKPPDIFKGWYSDPTRNGLTFVLKDGGRTFEQFQNDDEVLYKLRLDSIPHGPFQVQVHKSYGGSFELSFLIN